MGPRSHERGKIAGASFETPQSEFYIQTASMGPRSHERGNFIGFRPSGSMSIITLQWGRVLMNAETQASRVPVDAGIVLASMGPRSHERGNQPLEIIRLVENKCPLQWGRVLMNAETCQVVAMARRLRSHASMGPRSHERGNGDAFGNRSPDGLASMGPRSHERGNFLCCHSAAADTASPLQWGRVLMNAETSDRPA